MGIEETFERIAVALERIASTQEANTKINASYKEHLTKEHPMPVLTSPRPAAMAASLPNASPAELRAQVGAGLRAEQEAEEAAAEASQPQSEMTFEELKAALHIRGYDFPKGTKRTTLAKAWEAHKDEPVKPHEPSPVEPPPLDVNPAGYAPSLIEAPAPAPAEAPAPAPESAKPLSRDEAAARIRAHYTASPEDREIFKKALVAAGVQENGSFRDVSDGKFDILVEAYERLKGIANA